MNIYALTSLEIGHRMAQAIHATVPLAGVIGLDHAATNMSGYAPADELASELGCEYVPVDRYNLASSNAKERLLNLDIDVLFVCGWQRLVPEWLIANCQVGAVGIHGSSSGITSGRGRSPQTWALLLGKKKFSVSIFFLEPGIDSGRIIDTCEFELTEFDDIADSNIKVADCASTMFVNAVRKGNLDPALAQAQDNHVAAYLPQRLPEDGQLDWNRSSQDIYNFVRSMTRPYPGAFSNFDGGKIVIWRLRPLTSSRAVIRYEAGFVISNDPSGLVISTGDGQVLVDDFEVSGREPLPGTQLSSVSFQEQMRAIVKRHQAKYPKLPIAREILDLAQL